MTATFLELLKDANLIKFFAIVGSVFFLFGITGRVWGVRDPISQVSKITLVIAGIFLIAGAFIGFIDNKNQYFSDAINNGSQELLGQDQRHTATNSQSIKGNDNKMIGNTVGNNNQIVQGDNNNLNSNNTNIVNKHYTEGDYTVYYTLNTVSKDTLSKKKVRNQAFENENSEVENEKLKINLIGRWRIEYPVYNGNSQNKDEILYRQEIIIDYRANGTFSSQQYKNGNIEEYKAGNWKVVNLKLYSKISKEYTDNEKETQWSKEGYPVIFKDKDSWVTDSGIWKRQKF